MKGMFALPCFLSKLLLAEILVDLNLIQGYFHTLMLAKKKKQRLKVIVLVQENKNYLRKRKSKSRKKRHSEDSEEDTVIEHFTLIKYLLNRNKCGGILNRSFWILMFKQSEKNIRPRLPRINRGTLNDVLDPLI